MDKPDPQDLILEILQHHEGWRSFGFIVFEAMKLHEDLAMLEATSDPQVFGIRPEIRKALNNLLHEQKIEYDSDLLLWRARFTLEEGVGYNGGRIPGRRIER